MCVALLGELKPLTGVITKRSTIVLSPTEPSSFLPEQKTAPVLEIRHTFADPTSKSMTWSVSNPITGVGVAVSVVELSPSSPSKFAPKQ